MVVGLVAGLVAATCFGLASVLQAHAVRALPVSAVDLRAFLTAAARDRLLVLVVVGYLVGFLLHAVAIWLLPLYLAQAAIAMSLPITALGASRVDEQVSLRQWLALGAVVIGLWLLAAGAGDPGAVRVSPAFVAWLVGGLAGLGLAAAALRQAVVRATLSGLAYAGSAIAVRGVTGSWHPLVIAAGATVCLYGVLGFWLYSSGLESAEVSSATAPLIVGQTAVPAVIGLAFLGDGVRAGWGAAIVAGLVLATAGASVVPRAAAAPDQAATP